MTKRRTSRKAAPAEPPVEMTEEQDRQAAELAYARAEAWAQSPSGTHYGSIVIPTMQAVMEQSK